MLVMGSTIFLLILAHFCSDAEVWETGKEGGLGGKAKELLQAGLGHKTCAPVTAKEQSIMKCTVSHVKVPLM